MNLANLIKYMENIAGPRILPIYSGTHDFSILLGTGTVGFPKTFGAGAWVRVRSKISRPQGL